MKPKLYSILFFLCIIIAYEVNGQEQAFGKTSLTYGVGIGVVDKIEIHGLGGLFFCGFNQEIGKGRFRLSTQLSLGFFNSNWITDIPDQAFYSVSLTPIFFADALRYKAISLTVGGGVVVNNMRGLIGTGGYPPGNREQYYFSNWNYGVYLGGGLRINPKKSRVAIEVFPFNFQFGSAYYLESYWRLGVEVKLNK